MTTDRSPFPFIVACGRSGTTLLRAMLDSHPDFAIPPETRLLTLAKRWRSPITPDLVDSFVADAETFYWFRNFELDGDEVRSRLREEPIPYDYAEAIRRIFSLYAAARGKSRYGNKTPVHALSLPELSRMFPESRFIHIIRDGRNAALSFVEFERGPDTLEWAALRWRRRIRTARRDGIALGPQRYLEVRYEDLVADPQNVIERLCEFIEIPFDPQMLNYFERAQDVVKGHRLPHRFQHLSRPPTAGLRDWREEMSAAQVRAFEALTGDVLAELGYELASHPSHLAAVAARTRASSALAVEAGRRAKRIVSRRLFPSKKESE